MNDLYIYYQVRETDAAALAPLVRAMQDRLAAAHGVAAQLKRRPQARDGLQTWMEIYTATGAEFAGALAAAVQEAGIDASIVGQRHTEVFRDLIPCA